VLAGTPVDNWGC